MTALNGRSGPAPKPVSGYSADDIPAPIRKAIHERSGGLCELRCGRRAEHLHHRLMRSQQGPHTVENLLDVCHRHHEQIHAHPSESYTRRWLLRSGSNPADLMPLELLDPWSLPLVTGGAA